MKENRQILTLLFVGVLMGALDIAIIGPAFTTIRNSFHASDRLIPWLLNIYILCNLVSTPLMGKLSDLIGRKWIYILDILIFALGSIVVIASNSFGMVLVGRAIQGFGAGGIFPVASAVIGDTMPKEKQGSALGLIGAVFGLAFIIGPILGGALLLIHWKLIFVINLPLAAILIPWAYKIMPSKRISAKISLDWAGLLTLMVSLTAYVYSINQVDPTRLTESILRWNVLPVYLFAVILLPVFFFLQKRTDVPVFPPRLLQARQLVISFAIAFGAGLAQLVVVYLPSIAQIRFMVSDAQSSFMLMPLVVALFFSAPLAGRLIDKLGSRIILQAGLLILASGQFIFSFLLTGKAWFYFAEVLVGIGMAFLVGAPLRYIMNRETHEEERASGQALLTLFTSTGQLSGAAFTGALVASLGGGLEGYRLSFKILIGIIVILFLSSFGLKSRPSEQAA
jgi:MFS family permease